MKKLILSVGAAILSAGFAVAGEKWSSYTTDDFSQKLLFAEYWKVDNASAVKSEGGRAVFSGKVMMIPKAKTPKKFRASVDLEVTKGTADLRCGTTVAEVKAGEKKRVTIACEGDQEGFAPIRICFDGEGFADNFEVMSATDDSASPNLIINGGMEYVEDGVPPYMKHGNSFPKDQLLKYDYRKYLKMFGADAKNPHSGKYSLRLSCNRVINQQHVGIVRIASQKGRAGVLSLWAKTDRPGVRFSFNYAGSRRTVELTNAWTRYEVVSTNLPGAAFFQKLAGFRVMLPEEMRDATVWVDDIQAEYLDRVPTAAELASGKTFATPFRENDFDKTRFSEIVPHRAPTIEVPLLKGAKASVKLDDWVGGAAKFGDFYNLLTPVAHRTDAYIACDDENIYVGVRAYGEAFRKRPEGQAEWHDSTGIFGSQRSSVEFMLDPTGDSKIWHFAFNDFGYWDAGENRDVKWTGEWTHELVKNEKSDATDYFIAIPWKHLKHHGLKDAFPVLVGRNDEAAGQFSIPFAAERAGFAGTYDWWPLAKFPADIVAKHRLANNAAQGGAKTRVMPWLSYYMNEPAARFRVTTPDGKVREESVDLAKMPYGTNTVTVAGTEQKVIKLPYRKYGCQVNHWARCLRKDGRNILHCGPFPGDFIFNWQFGPHGAISYVDFYHKYCNFKYLHLLIPPGKDSRYYDGEPYAGLHAGRLALERARQFGIPVLVWTDFGGVEAKDAAEAAQHQKIADQFLEFDNITSFLVVDEPELGRFTSEQTSRYMDRVRKLFPYNPVQMNNTIMGIPNNWANLNTDVLMLDNYLTSNDQGLVSGVVKCVDEMREKGAETGKPCFYFITSVNGHHYKEPTRAEQIAQSWGCICAGCTGLSYYEGIPTVLGAFEGMVQVAGEIGAVEDLLVSDELCGEAVASVGTKDLKVLTRTLKGRSLIATCNIQKKPLGTVEFTLPADFPQDGTVKVLFEDRTIPVKNGRFSDDYDVYERHVYEFVK